MTTLLWTAAVVGALWAQRALRAARMEAAFRARHPVNAEGVIIGAEARTYERSRSRAILLIHGYNDSPTSLDGIGRVLADAGWTVRLPLLPGHGRSLEAFDRWTSDDVLWEVRQEYAELRAKYRTVVVGGLSMGGALACWLAAEGDADAVVLFAPMLFVPRPMQVAVSTARLWSLLSKYIGGGSGRSIRNPEARRRLIAYGYSTRRSLEALEGIAEGSIVRLGFVKAPTLIQQSEEDNRLPRDQSKRAFTRLGAKDRTVRWVEGAGHVLTLDYGWETVATRAAAWLAEHFDAEPMPDAGRRAAV
ncbi:MAG: alpha/beta fold hydrolase [Gemmatimonadaceae bacterium]